MCKIWIVCVDGVRVMDAASAQPANRIEPLSSPTKGSRQPGAKKADAPAVVSRTTDTALQCGGTLVSGKSSYGDKDDNWEHYRQRCGEHNNRQQACFHTERRRQAVRY